MHIQHKIRNLHWKLFEENQYWESVKWWNRSDYVIRYRKRKRNYSENSKSKLVTSGLNWNTTASFTFGNANPSSSAMLQTIVAFSFGIFSLYFLGPARRRLMGLVPFWPLWVTINNWGARVFNTQRAANFSLPNFICSSDWNDFNVLSRAEAKGRAIYASMRINQWLWFTCRCSTGLPAVQALNIKSSTMAS